MFYVYILRSIQSESHTYIGFTADLRARLEKHNEGGCPYTSKFKPWRIIWYCAFQDKIKALENFFKSIYLSKRYYIIYI